jgi:hypothetical protein
MHCLPRWPWKCMDTRELGIEPGKALPVGDNLGRDGCSQSDLWTVFVALCFPSLISMVLIGGQLPLVIVDDHEPIWDWLQSGFDAFGIWHQEESWAEKPRLQCSFCEVPKKRCNSNFILSQESMGIWESSRWESQISQHATVSSEPLV